jgi:hypothetical protein
MADKELNGQTFENPSVTPSAKSRIVDGEYVENAPDPTEARGLGGRRTSGGRLLPDLPSTEYDAAVESKTPAKKAAAPKA